MQRLPENCSVLNNRLERPAPNNPVEGDEIVHSMRKRMAKVNPLVVGSSPTGPTKSALILSNVAGDRGGFILSALTGRAFHPILKIDPPQATAQA